MRRTAIRRLTRRRPARAPAAVNAPRAAKPHDALVDAFLESYICWREACDEVRRAYEDWRNCEPHRWAPAFHGYRSALDREQYAAGVHSDMTQQLRVSVG